MIKYENLLKETKAYKTLYQDIKNGALSHCNMIISEDSIACNNLCLLIARAILCEHDNCGICKSCVDVENGVHLGLITPDALNADGLRYLASRCYSGVDSDSKVVLIQNFQDIAPSEQNKLLKLLEEPIGNTTFILGVTKPSNVLETIKSRSTKFIIESFRNESIMQVLKEDYDDYTAAKAVEFAEGSITKALSIIANEKLIECYDLMKLALLNMDSSKKILDYIAQMKLDKSETYLEALEILVKQILERKTHVTKGSEDDIAKLVEKYNVATLVNIESLVIDAKMKLDQYCNPEGVIYKLLMGILEVKYKCQQ